ncbi:MAG TPA: hypothetical protein VM734_14345 [Kofleriaceae bacterium]|nr:hypothetical protein [Kofleriaceae bacterium]
MITVIVGAVDRDTADEALRGAVGLTLRGARVRVVLADPAIELGPRGERARAVLTTFGHPVVGAAGLADALASPAIEVWGPVTGPADGPDHGRPTLHLVRPGRAPVAVSPGDTVVHLGPSLDDERADLVLSFPGPVAVW